MRRNFLSLLIILYTTNLFADFALYNLENLNNQLSNNAILCMHQDYYGFMWFGTYDGLNLYDGKKVTSFRYEMNNPNSLSGNTIHNIQSLGHDYLWVATQVGLNKFSLKERRVVESYSEYIVYDLIATDSHQNTWVFIKDNYISYYDALQQTFHDLYLDNTEWHTVKSIFTDTEDRLWMIRDDGVIQHLNIDIKERNQTLISISERQLHDKHINKTIYEDGLVYFIDEDGGLYLYDVVKQQKILLRNISEVIDQYGPVASLVFFQQEIFIAFIHSGLVRLDVSSLNEPEPIDITIGVFFLHKDRFQDAIWVGTDGQGVELYYNEKDIFNNILFEKLPFTSRRPVRAVYTDEDNTLWVGTKGDGILRIQDYSGFHNESIPSANISRFIAYPGIYENPVYCFIRSKYNHNDLWFGTDDGISYFSYEEEKIYQLEDNPELGKMLSNVHTLCEVNDSTLWVSSRGLYKVIIDKSSKPYRIKSKKSYIPEHNNVEVYDEYYSIVYDGDSKLYAGSRRGYGVLCLNIHTDEYEYVSLEGAENKALGEIICLYLDKDSVLYVGAGSGLTQIKMLSGENNQIKQFGRNDGILNDMVHGILEDNKGIIWLSTNKGLVKYNPENDSFFNIKSSRIGVLEYSDGAYWCCPLTDRLFYGGVNGLVWLEPNNGNGDFLYEPDLLFTELSSFEFKQTLYNYNLGRGEVLKLLPDQNTFQISFAVLDYIHGDSYDFSYMLENYDDDWISLQKENKINFTKIPHGDYLLKVKYKNDVVQADTKIYSIPITILPPWYLSKVAYVVYLVLLFVVLLLVLLYVQWKFRQKQALIAQKIKEEQRQKLYESKQRFFTNVTHELYTPLTLINGALDQIEKEEGSERLKKYTGILQNNVRSLNDLIKEILEYRKIEESVIDPNSVQKVFVSDILKNLLNSFADIAKRSEIELITEVADDIYWVTDRSCFKKIVSNLISNAFKYTPENGTVKVRVYVESESDSLKIVVYNTGRGIEPDKLKTVFNRYLILENSDVNAKSQMTARSGLGLNICHTMTKLLQGEIEVESVVDDYTQFTVTLPNLVHIEPVSTENIISEVPESTPQEKPKELSQLDISKIEKSESATILVVDDNQEIVEMISDILSPDYKILKAYNAIEVLRILKKQTPLLIITDIMMPEIDGLSFIQRVRNNKFIRHLPIIALSAKVEQQDQVRGYEAGADVYVTKPFSSEILYSMVKRLLLNTEEAKKYYDSIESSFEYTQGKILHQKEKEFIDIVVTIINENISNPELGPQMIADQMKMSSRNLYRQLKQIFDISPSNFIKDYKLTYASKLLLSTNLSVKEIIHKIGITNKSYFYREFLKKFNMSPMQFKDTNKKGLEKVE